MIAGKSIKDHFNTVRYSIGYCPQQQALFSGITVREHLNFYSRLKGIPEATREATILKICNQLRIRSILDKLAHTLSGGNKRKLQMAIAILGNPSVLLMDEPSSGMDPASRQFMWRVVKSITASQPQSCMVLSTHSMTEAEALSTKMGIMVKGGIFKCFGSPEHIKA